MPLIKKTTKKAFQANLKKELKAKKPKQAIAIAFSIKEKIMPKVKMKKAR